MVADENFILLFQKFPDLKFKYVEEDRPEEFFIPYVWSLVCQASGIHWNMDKVKLFFPESSEVACWPKLVPRLFTNLCVHRLGWILIKPLCSIYKVWMQMLIFNCYFNPIHVLILWI